MCSHVDGFTLLEIPWLSSDVFMEGFIYMERKALEIDNVQPSGGLCSLNTHDKEIPGQEQS